MFVHVALTEQPPLLVAHSLTSLQGVMPSHVYPVGQAQVRVVGLMGVQVAAGRQPPLPVAQGLPAVQVIPLPLYPELQAQVREPGVLVQVAFTEQPPLLLEHSLTSLQ